MLGAAYLMVVIYGLWQWWLWAGLPEPENDVLGGRVSTEKAVWPGLSLREGRLWYSAEMACLGQGWNKQKTYS